MEWADAELLRAYRATVWRVDMAGGPLDLRVGEPVPGDRISLPAAVITAYNPRSALRPAEENAVAQRRLRESLLQMGAELRPVVAGGTGPEPAAWSEPGFLLSGIPRERVVEIASSFDQNAVLWIGEEGIPKLLVTRPGFAGAAVGAEL